MKLAILALIAFCAAGKGKGKGEVQLRQRNLCRDAGRHMVILAFDIMDNMEGITKDPTPELLKAMFPATQNWVKYCFNKTLDIKAYEHCVDTNAPALETLKKMIGDLYGSEWGTVGIDAAIVIPQLVDGIRSCVADAQKQKGLHIFS